MSSPKNLLPKICNLLFPGVSLDKSSAPRLAAELRRFAGQLEEIEPSLPDGDASTASETKVGGTNKREKKKVRRSFDFSRFQQRFVAFELYYVGWDFHGFAAQEFIENTVEGHFFRALKKICLIPEDAAWDDFKYSRCGRTDIGVSASGQTVALMVRSAAACDGTPLPSVEDELDYPQMINRVLPRDIRVVGWTPVTEDFHARFSARFREYKYYIAGSHPYPRLA